MVQRVYLVGLALAPALAVLLFPFPALSAPATLALGGAGGLFGLWASLTQRAGASMAAHRARLLLRSDIKDLPINLPNPDQARARLIEITLPVQESPEAPPSRANAIAGVLTRIVQGWGHHSFDELFVDQIMALTVLDRLLRATSQQAGELAQLFVRPDLMLDLRDGVNEIAAIRAIYDRNRAAFEATGLLWEAQTKGHAPKGLLAALCALEVPDPDLWHHVILNHDRTDPDQRAAALWCLGQPGCDRASIAVYMADLAASDGLLHAARRGDDDLLGQVRAVIEGLNAGSFAQAEIALDPVDAVVGHTQRFNDMLAALADQTGEMRWPAPCGLFTEYKGRAAQARDHWCLRSGALSAPPEARDYFPAADTTA